MKRRCCFFCRHTQGKHTGENFAFVCDVSGNAVDPEADSCGDFSPEGKKKPKGKNPKKGTPPAARQGASFGRAKYSIKSRIVRRVCRGLKQWTFYPRNEREELALSELFDLIGNMITTYARKVARKAVSRIGKD